MRWSIRKRLTVVAAALISVAVPAVAGASGTPSFHGTAENQPNVWQDFCGTGVDLPTSFTISFTGWDLGNNVIKFKGEGTVRITNPANGKTALLHQAYLETGLWTTDTSGAHTLHGVAQQLLIPGQGVVDLEAGQMTVQLVRDANGQITEGQVISAHGTFDPGSQFCQAAIPGLGL